MCKTTTQASRTYPNITGQCNKNRAAQALTIDLGDRAIVDGPQSSLWNAEVGLLFRAQGLQLLSQGLQPLDCGCHALHCHVQLKAIVLSSEQRLLILVLAHELHAVSCLECGLTCSLSFDLPHRLYCGPIWT